MSKKIIALLLSLAMFFAMAACAAETPTTDAPAEETPAVETPAEEKPAEEIPATDETPAEEAPSDDDVDGELILDYEEELSL